MGLRSEEELRRDKVQAAESKWWHSCLLMICGRWACMPGTWGAWGSVGSTTNQQHRSRLITLSQLLSSRLGVSKPTHLLAAEAGIPATWGPHRAQMLRTKCAVLPSEKQSSPGWPSLKLTLLKMETSECLWRSGGNENPETPCHAFRYYNQILLRMASLHRVNQGYQGKCPAFDVCQSPQVITWHGAS